MPPSEEQWPPGSSGLVLRSFWSNVEFIKRRNHNVRIPIIPKLQMFKIPCAGRIDVCSLHPNGLLELDKFLYYSKTGWSAETPPQQRKE